MFDLQLLNKVNEVEKQTGQSLPGLLSKVPLGNVLMAFKELQVADLVEMVSSVSISKLTRGLTIITPDEISQISPEKLKIVLKHGNMLTVERLQSKFGSRSIIIAINKLTENELQSLLAEDNYDVMSDVIENLAFAKASAGLPQKEVEMTIEELYEYAKSRGLEHKQILIADIDCLYTSFFTVEEYQTNRDFVILETDQKRHSINAVSFVCKELVVTNLEQISIAQICLCVTEY